MASRCCRRVGRTELITDNLVDTFDVPLLTTTICCSILLAATFAAWFASEKTLSIHTIVTTRREIFYWLAILFTFALVTAVGDYIAETPGLGHLLRAWSSSSATAHLARDHEEAIYLQIASDRLNGTLPIRNTENELARRYELTRSRLDIVLRRMAKEGWIERLPGNGWEFLPVLTSLESMQTATAFDF